jgi:hypothetical protein
VDEKRPICFQGAVMPKTQAPKQDQRSRRLAAALKRNIARRKAAPLAKADKK